MDTPTSPVDPILEFLGETGGIDPSDDFLMHMISLTDVVKNDMKKSWDLDEDTINERLTRLIETSLDHNQRYKVKPGRTNTDGGKRYPLRYTQAQCLVTEWIGLYRVIRVYLSAKQR
jgi:hypothetical protein